MTKLLRVNREAVWRKYVHCSTLPLVTYDSFTFMLMSLFSTTHWSSIHITAASKPSCLSICHSTLLSLVKGMPRYLNPSTWGNDSFPTQSGHTSVFWLRTMASELILIQPLHTQLQTAQGQAGGHRLKPTTSSAKQR